MDYNLLNQYGIIILIIIFICINIYYKNIINILIFIFIYLGLRNMMTDSNALILSYIFSLLYGIVKNFHLLENFAYIVKKSSNQPIKINNDNDNDNDNTNTNANDNANDNTNANANANANDNVNDNANDNTNANANANTNDNTNPNSNTNKKNKMNDLDLFVSEELINQFINKCKEVDSLLIEKTKQNIYDLKPTIKTMKKNKLNKLKKTMSDDEINKPIIISNDNFIVDGHYRWYIKKNLIENNTNGLDRNDIYNENINVVKINYDIKHLLNKLKEYKIKYNEEYLSSNVLDNTKIKEGYKLINNIKKDIGSLENIYNLINTKIKLV